jgi:sugar transferase (PEP-CTERM/EpsH1 system associated)
MEKVLFLAHRIPYPPNKGDKIRSFHFLKHLARRYDIYLGAFVDDADDWRHEEKLRGWCREVNLVGLRPVIGKIRALLGLFSGQPLSVPYFFSRSMSTWVRRTIAECGIDHIVVYSSPMAQYVDADAYRGLCRVADLVDVDSEKWRMYSEHHRGLSRWIYRREARKLLDFERDVSRCFDSTVFVSKEEADLFRGLLHGRPGNVTHVSNGVDTAYFSPDETRSCPYSPDEGVLVFTGAMDYWANVDAVVWYANEIFPKILDQQPAARFYIVGARPAAAVRRLADRPGVHVTGAVEDVRPYVQHAKAAVAPLRVARGIQNKVLEAMAMAKPVVATPAAMEGIDPPVGYESLISDDPKQLAQASLKQLARPDVDLGVRGREFVLAGFSWDSTLQALDELMAAAAESRTLASGISEFDREAQQ